MFVLQIADMVGIEQWRQAIGLSCVLFLQNNQYLLALDLDCYMNGNPKTFKTGHLDSGI